MPDEAKFHSDRAMAELDLAAKAPDRCAAEVHLQLSRRHIEQLRALSGGPALQPGY
ncbi:MAG: hypothetical protein JO013_04470 [Alphaproteobacteria bacterium]|nr:hypothetical protein [Alphaproteobacteria bacterium]